MRVPIAWLREYLKSDISATDLAEALTMGGLEVEEVRTWEGPAGESDEILLTKVLSNRGDLLSMIGVARHAAAVLKSSWQMPSFAALPAATVGVPEVAEGDVKVTIEDLEGCPRYSALAIRNVKIGPSPEWLQRRLESAGIRPISNVVDVTNYVCWELGQPMHAFDLRLVARNHIIVRRARPGEKLKLLNEDTIELHEKDLMICDEMGPVALAGVMGGLETEVNERTKSVLLESAHFDPPTVRRGAQRHGLGTEASYRFERHVDPNMTLPALARAAELIVQIAGGEVDPVALDVRAADFAPRTVNLRPDRCCKVLGADLTPEHMADCLERLGMQVTPSAGILAVQVPTFRHEVTREIDLVEEVAIVHGYNNIPATVPGALQHAGLLTQRQKTERRVRELLRQCGLNETISFSFMGMEDLDRCGFAPNAPERNALKLAMPVSADMSHLRTTLIPGLLSAAAVNVRQRVLDVALYDVDRVFWPQGEGQLPQEKRRVGGIMMGVALTSDWGTKDAQVDFYALKAVVEQLCDGLNVPPVEYRRATAPMFHPGRCAEVWMESRCIGVMGEAATTVQEAYDLPARAYLFELELDPLLEGARPHRQYDPLPRFPAALRDLALVVADDDAHSAAALELAIREVGGEWLWKVAAFDLYRDPERLGEGLKSVAFRLTFRSPDRTLTDEELDAAMARISSHVEDKLEAKVRQA